MERSARHPLRAKPVCLAHHDREDRDRQRRPDHEHARGTADRRGLLRLRPDHEARRVAQRDDRHAERVAQLKEARRLVRTFRVNCARQVAAIIGNHAHGTAVQPRQPGDHPLRPATAQLDEGTSVEQPVDRAADVEHAQPILWHHVPQQPLVRRISARHPPLEKRQQPPREIGRLRLILCQHVDRTAVPMHLDRPDFLGRIDAEPTALDHCRATDADMRVARGDRDVAAAEQHGIARKGIAGRDPDPRRNTGQRGKAAERRHVEPRRADRIDVPRPSPAALGIEDDRQLQLARNTEQPIGLAVVHMALRARQHGIVIGEAKALGGFLAMIRGIHRADPADQAVGGGVAHQIVEGPAPSLRRDRQRAIFDEAARIEQVVDILARRALVGAPPPLHGCRPVLVEAQRMACAHLGKIVAYQVQVERRSVGRDILVTISWLDRDEHRALVDHSPGLGHDRAHDAAVCRHNGMLHLQRLDRA